MKWFSAWCGYCDSEGGIMVLWLQHQDQLYTGSHSLPWVKGYRDLDGEGSMSHWLGWWWRCVPWRLVFPLSQGLVSRFISFKGNKHAFPYLLSFSLHYTFNILEVASQGPGYNGFPKVGLMVWCLPRFHCFQRLLVKVNTVKGSFLCG